MRKTLQLWPDEGDGTIRVTTTADYRGRGGAWHSRSESVSFPAAAFERDPHGLMAERLARARAWRRADVPRAY